MITSQITLAKTRKEREQRLRERVAKLEAALEQIASCEKRCDGDVVDIARKALSD